MIRLILFFSSLVLVTSAAFAQTVTFDPKLSTATSEMKALPAHVGGRVLMTPLPEPMPSGATRFVHQWPGVYFEAGFEGEQVMLRFDDSLNEYRLLIDDLAPIQIAQPGRTEVHIAGLANSTHRLRLEKMTESVDHSAAFDGFYVPADERVITTPARARRMEFIGDSAMTGYGIRSATRQCSKEEVRLLTDTQAAYPALVSNRFGADYQVNAISGRGLIRNFGGVEPDDPMTHAYDFAVRDIGAPLRDATWQPQIIVVSLFADFAGELGPSEPWKTMGEVGAAWIDGYVAFLRQLHARAPEAALVVGWPNMAQQTDSEFISLVDRAREAILSAADQSGFRVVLMEMPTGQDYELSACDYHPSIGDQRRLADHVGRFIDAYSELWGDPR